MQSHHVDSLNRTLPAAYTGFSSTTLVTMQVLTPVKNNVPNNSAHGLEF
jgi:hypothetical protein